MGRLSRARGVRFSGCRTSRVACDVDVACGVDLEKGRGDSTVRLLDCRSSCVGDLPHFAVGGAWCPAESGVDMAATGLNEVYTDEQALSIYDESVRFGREVYKTVRSSAGFVVSATAFYGLFMLTQMFQRGLSAQHRTPDVVMPSASGSLLTTAFTILLAVIIAVWFSPNTFRLGAAESPVTIARELAAQTIVTMIARLGVYLSLGLVLWAFLSFAMSAAPRQIDIVRMVLPVPLGIGFALWFAAAEVRLGEGPNQKMLWARHHRESERLRRIIADERALRSRGARGLCRVCSCSG